MQEELNKKEESQKNEFVKQLTQEKYKYGFTTEVHTDIIEKGLNEDVVRLISAKKGEPEWLLEFRLKAYRYWLTMEMPTWAHLNIPEIDYQAISYYADPTKKKEGPKSMDEVDPELVKTFNKLGIPLEEQMALSGMAVDAVMDSVSVKTTFKETLMEKGYAYDVNGTVYFRTRKFEEYGKLSHKNLDDLRSGNRSLLVSGEDQKEDPLDFVLWKPKKEGEPFWKSPWSDGRPGWHIECSVMSRKYLGEQIDIHAGGEDLIFPHHENEIAQSEAANGKEFARYWMHNAFLNIDNRKMSKSLGNFRTVREISEQYDLQVLRFFMLSAHYRSPLNFSAELMEASKNGLERILNATDNLKHLIASVAAEEMSAEEKEAFSKTDAYVEEFEKAMDDDFNTADAISAIFELVKLANSNSSSDNSKEYIDTLMKKITTLTDILGLKTDKKEEMLDEDIEALIAERQQARKDKNFARADEIRDELLAKGIVLKDTREGVRWSRA